MDDLVSERIKKIEALQEAGATYSDVIQTLVDEAGTIIAKNIAYAERTGEIPPSEDRDRKAVLELMNLILSLTQAKILTIN